MTAFNDAPAFSYSTLVVVIGGLIGLFRWFGDEEAEIHRTKILGSSRRALQDCCCCIGKWKGRHPGWWCYSPRSFLNKDDKEIYGRYYTQIFGVFRCIFASLKNRLSHQKIRINYLAYQRTSILLYRSLPSAKLSIVVFKEAFPLARKQYRILLMPDPDIPLSLMARLKESMTGVFCGSSSLY